MTPEEAIEDVVSRVVDEIDGDPSPSEVEDETRRVVSGHSFVDHGSKEAHIQIRNDAVSEDWSDMTDVSSDDLPQVIQRGARRALVEYAKRRALHEIRRAQIHSESDVRR